MTLPTAEGDEPYEQLVRQQLDALGYDSAAIPDDVRAILTHSARLSCPLLEPPHRLRPQVLRAFLKDFDDKMELQEDAGPEAARKDLSVLDTLVRIGPKRYYSNVLGYGPFWPWPKTLL